MSNKFMNAWSLEKTSKYVSFISGQEKTQVSLPRARKVCSWANENRS